MRRNRSRGSLATYTVRCPMLSSGERYSTVAEVEDPWPFGLPPPPPPLPDRLGSAHELELQQRIGEALVESRAPLSDLSLCSPTPAELEARGLVGYEP